MRYKQWYFEETRHRWALALAELKVAENDMRALELKGERLLSRKNELEYILAEIHNRRERSLRIQKPYCWAMSG